MIDDVDQATKVIEEQGSQLRPLLIVSLKDIDKGGIETLLSVRSSLARDSAIILDVSGSDALHERSITASTFFFDAPDTVKSEVEGKQYFRRKFGDRRIELSYGERVFQPSLAELLGGERGWIRRGTSPSKADKEYFQFGKYGNYSPRGSLTAKENIWPKHKAFRSFRRLKEEQLRLHERIHTAMLGVLQRDFVQEHYRGGKWSAPYEIICRDTLYHPSGACSASNVNTGKGVRNPAHVDLSNGTLVHFRDGLQLYTGKHREKAAISNDERSWADLGSTKLPQDTLIYLVGLATEISTQGKYRAAWHRVTEGKSIGLNQYRSSIVSFCNAGIDDILLGGRDHAVSHISYPAVPRQILPVIGNQAYCDAMHTTNAECR